jgi:hypothetical protein
MTRHEPIPPMINTAAPKSAANVDVSPIEPGMNPKKASIHDTDMLNAGSATSARGVALLTPSTATQTLSPEICAGYAKYHGKKQAGYQKAFINFVFSHRGEYQFPDTTRYKGYDVHREKVERAVEHTGNNAVRTEPDTERGKHIQAPTLYGQLPSWKIKRRRHLLQNKIRLEPGVIECYEHGGNQAVHYPHHNPFQIHLIANM